MSTREVVKKVQNAILYSDGTIRLDNVRISYPHLAKPFEGENDDGKKKLTYSVAAMLPKSSHKEAKDLIKSVIQKLIDSNETKVATDKWFLSDGDQTDKDEYMGHFIVKGSEARRPTCRKRNGEVMTEAEIENMIYGGCWGNILIRPWLFNGKAKNGKTYPKRVSANLIAFQFVRDDEAFGEGRITDEGVFDEASDDGYGDFDDNDGL